MITKYQIKYFNSFSKYLLYFSCTNTTNIFRHQGNFQRFFLLFFISQNVSHTIATFPNVFFLYFEIRMIKCFADCLSSLKLSCKLIYLKVVEIFTKITK